ncbi:integrase core domain-containing protein [Thermodesulfovibrionales bacterium]|nr:integrase core domain-containing protein [Thermodesulfovibrionales bacterium]
MKSSYTKRYLTKNLNLPVHFGRPHTPDDQAWIEAFIKTLKYHREAPSHFPQVADVIDWFQRFPSIYNHEPHSSLGYVTPAQTLAGLKEVILTQRKQNLYEARQARLAAYRDSENWLPEVISISKGGQFRKKIPHPGTHQQ